MSKRVITEKKDGLRYVHDKTALCCKGPARPHLVYADRSPSTHLHSLPRPQSLSVVPQTNTEAQFHPRAFAPAVQPGGPSALTHLPVTSPPSLLMGHLLGSLSPISPLNHQPAHPPHPLTHTPLHCLSSYLLTPSNKLMI